MDAIVQYILNQSKLGVSHIIITEPTKTDFLMEIHARAVNTGPLGATMSPMTVDLVGPAGIFGRLDLPEVKTKPSGTDVHIAPQRIQILSQDAFYAFVKAIMLDDQLTLRLENGTGTIKAMLGMKANIVYQKDIELAGMGGPKARIVSTEGTREDLTLTLEVLNPSPLETDLGVALYELRAADGTTIGNVKGSLRVMRGGSTHVMKGALTCPATAGAANLVGVGAEGESCAADINKFLNMAVEISSELAAM